MTPPDLWIFAYGSLVWRPAIPHAESRRATVRGWARRFWQGSTDHRGVPGAPGRVVTLVEARDARCDGVAYRVAPADRARVLRELDVRERGGYERLDLALEWVDTAEPRPGAVALTYVAAAHNPNYLGPAPLPAIAAQVRRSHGPSGSNVEYVLRLADALRRLDAEDPHVFGLEALLQEETS